MRDQWATYAEQVMGWTARLPLAAASGERTLGWMERVVERGEREEVYRVLETPWIGRGEVEAGSLGKVVRERFERDGVLDLFGFDSQAPGPTGRTRTTARLAYRDGDRLVEGAVSRLEEVVARTRPEAAEVGPIEPARPMSVSGFPIDYRDPDAPLFVDKIPFVRVRFLFHTDIWLPWVWGHYVPRGQLAAELYDNGAVAERHTPRLNAFLATAREETLAIGGTWQLEDDDMLMHLRAQVDERGILLDCARPPRRRAG
jgi:hypothetical protein